MAGIVWSKRLAKLLAVAVLVAVTCVALGIWQIARLHQKQQFNAAVRAGLALAPAPVDAVLTDGVDPDAVRYRRATATGTYDTEHGFVLYGRTQDSQAGNHLLTPLILSDGRAILVDRGWVPLDIDDTRGAGGRSPDRSRGRRRRAVPVGGRSSRSRRHRRPGGDDAVEGRSGDDPVTAPLRHRTELSPAPTADPRASRTGSRSPLPCRSCPRARTSAMRSSGSRSP